MLAEVIAFCNTNHAAVTAALGAAGALLGGRRLAIRRAAMNFARRKAELAAVEAEATRPISDEGSVGVKSLRVLRRALDLGAGMWSLQKSGNYLCKHPDFDGVVMWWFDGMPRKYRVGKSRWKYHIGGADVTYLMTKPERLYLVASSDAIREQIRHTEVLNKITALPAAQPVPQPGNGAWPVTSSLTPAVFSLETYLHLEQAFLKTKSTDWICTISSEARYHCILPPYGSVTFWPIPHFNSQNHGFMYRLGTEVVNSKLTTGQMEALAILATAIVDTVVDGRRDNVFEIDKAVANWLKCHHCPGWLHLASYINNLLSRPDELELPADGTVIGGDAERRITVTGGGRPYLFRFNGLDISNAIPEVPRKTLCDKVDAVVREINAKKANASKVVAPAAPVGTTTVPQVAMPVDVAGFLKEQLSLVSGWAINADDPTYVFRITPTGIQTKVFRSAGESLPCMWKYRFYIADTDVSDKIPAIDRNILFRMANGKFADLKVAPPDGLQVELRLAMRDPSDWCTNYLVDGSKIVQESQSYRNGPWVILLVTGKAPIVVKGKVRVDVTVDSDQLNMITAYVGSVSFYEGLASYIRHAMSNLQRWKKVCNELSHNCYECEDYKVMVSYDSDNGRTVTGFHYRYFLNNVRAFDPETALPSARVTNVLGNYLNSLTNYAHKVREAVDPRYDVANLTQCILAALRMRDQWTRDAGQWVYKPDKRITFKFFNGGIVPVVFQYEGIELTHRMSDSHRATAKNLATDVVVGMG